MTEAYKEECARHSLDLIFNPGATLHCLQFLCGLPSLGVGKVHPLTIFKLTLISWALLTTASIFLRNKDEGLRRQLAR